MRKKLPNAHDFRIIYRFYIIPWIVFDEWIWLEGIYILQEYKQIYSRERDKWVNDREASEHEVNTFGINNMISENCYLEYYRKNFNKA